MEYVTKIECTVTRPTVGRNDPAREQKNSAFIRQGEDAAFSVMKELSKAGIACQKLTLDLQINQEPPDWIESFTESFKVTMYLYTEKPFDETTQKELKAILDKSNLRERSYTLDEQKVTIVYSPNIKSEEKISLSSEKSRSTLEKLFDSNGRRVTRWSWDFTIPNKNEAEDLGHKSPGFGSKT